MVHIHQSRDGSWTGPSGAALPAADSSQMGSMCLSEFVCQSGAVRETNPAWMARGVFAADALTGASIIASLPLGRLKMQSVQKIKPRCDPEQQTEAAVMNEAWGPRPQ